MPRFGTHSDFNRGEVEQCCAAEWVERCAEQLVRVDEDISDAAAQDLALELHRFERTAAMSPEAVVAFVRPEFSSGQPRFERRSVPSV